MEGQPSPVGAQSLVEVQQEGGFFVPQHHRDQVGFEVVINRLLI